MQTDPSAVALACKIVQPSYILRTVGYALEANWQKDTTDWVNGTWTNETRFVKQLSGNGSLLTAAQSMLSHGAIAPWTMKALLRNANGRYSPQRSDGPLYALIQGYRIYQTPVRAWVGFYNKSGTNPGSTTLTTVGGINASATTFTTGFALNAGEIIRMGSEDILVTRYNTLTVQNCIRGFHGTLPAAHAQTTVIARVGGCSKQFCGVIQSPPDSADYNAAWDCVDRFGLNIQEMLSSVAYTNLYPETLIANYLAQISSINGTEPLPPGQQQFEFGTFPVGVGYLDRESIILEAQKVAAGDSAILFCSKDGAPTLWSAQHWVGAASQYTFDKAQIISFKTLVTQQELFSTVITEYAPRALGVQVQVFKLNEDWSLPAAFTAAYSPAQTLNGAITAGATAIVVSGTVIRNGDVIRLFNESMLVTAGGLTNNLSVARGFANTTPAAHANGDAIVQVIPAVYSTTIRYDHGCTTVFTPQGNALVSPDKHHPVADKRDFAAQSGGGLDITGSLLLTNWQAFAQSANLTLANYNVSYGAFVFRFNVQAVPILGMPTKQFEATRVTTPSVSGREKIIGGNARNWNSQSEPQVRAQTNMLADRWAILRGTYEAVVRGMSLLEPGDVVAFTEAVTLSTQILAIVLTLDWTLGNIDQGKGDFQQTLVCADLANWYPSNNYAKVGTTALGTGVFFY